MFRFEEYLADFTNTVNILDFIINLIVATALSMLLKFFYIRFGKSFSNREKFSIIFVPMALATLLIITVVQASIALSLGLVGALSIVRFRAAIKEPEELTYIFLVIGIGLTCGANKPLLAIVAIVLILPLIYFNTRFSSQSIYAKNKMLFNLRTKSLDITKLSEVLSANMTHVELKRLDESGEDLYVTFLTKADNLNDLTSANKALKALDKDIQINIIDQPEMIL